MPASPVRILQTIRQGQIGGGESHVLDLVRGLDKTQFEPIVLSFTDGPMIDRLQEMNIKSYVIPSTQPFDIRLAKQVKQILKEESIDILHAHGSRAMSNTFSAARSLGLPVIYTVHGWSFHQDQRFPVRKLRELSEKLLTSKATHTICVSKSNERDGIERFGMKRSEVIYNGVDLNKFDHQLLSSYSIRRELNIPDDRILVGFVARMTKQKDPQTLIKGFKEALKLVPNLHLLLVGDGELRAAAETLVKTLQIEANITFAGFRLDIPQVLQSIDVFVLPSLWEGLPFGLLEAMAMKKASIATPVDGSQEIIKDGENGLFFPCGDYRALGAALVKVADKNLRDKLADNGLKTVQSTFGQENMVRRIEEAYHRVYAKK